MLALTLMATLVPPARADDSLLLDIVVLAPLPGSEADSARVPTSVRVLRGSDLDRSGTPSATAALDDNVAGVSLDQAVGNPFQPNLMFHGFEASPLVGNPQGLAVYVNGIRFNQSFGDTTNWDLIPDIAIDRIELTGPNPVFGLNALGGAVSVRLRDGFTFQGGGFAASGGSFGRLQSDLQYGVRSGGTAAYIAMAGLNDAGWRDHSPSLLRQLYGDVGWRGDKADLHVNLMAATTNLTGNGTTPVDLLAASRSAVFTYPDTTLNNYARLAVSLSHEISDALSLQANAYGSRFRQQTANGNASDAAPCAGDAGSLCASDGSAYTTSGGAGIPAFLGAGATYSALDSTSTTTNGYGASVQATHRSELSGHANRAVAGAGFDGGNTLFSARSELGALTADRGFSGPGTMIDQADGSIAPVRVGIANRYWGAYLSDALDVTPALTVTLSGRLNIAQIDLRDRLGTALNGDHNYARFNPAAGLTYQFTPWLSAYAGYSESNRAPTPAELSCASPAAPCTLTNFFVGDPALKQVIARSQEAGLRGAFTAGDDARYTWHAGVFRTRNDDDILFTTAEQLGRGYFANVGPTLRRGLEAGLSVRRGPYSVFLDYALTDAKFASSFLQGSGNDPAADANGNIQVRAGDRIPGVPMHRLKFGASASVAEDWTVSLTGIASSGEVLQGDASNQNADTGSYVVLNLKTAWQATERLEVFGIVQNLTNTHYATFGAFSPVSLVPIAQAPGTTNTRSLTPGAPSALYGGINVTF